MKQMTSFELYSKPEFKSLCEVLGIPWNLDTTYLNIEMDVNAFVKVIHRYTAQNAKYETTTLQNKEFKTFEPKEVN